MVCETLKKRENRGNKGFGLCREFSRDDGFTADPASDVDNSRVVVDDYFNCFRRPRPLEWEDFYRLFTKETNWVGAWPNVTEEKLFPKMTAQRKKVKLMKDPASSQEAKSHSRQNTTETPPLNLDEIPDCVILEIWEFMGRDDMRSVRELSWKTRWFRLEFESALTNERILEGNAVIWGNVVEKYEFEAWFC